jgi:hypothetical protein
MKKGNLGTFWRICEDDEVRTALKRDARRVDVHFGIELGCQDNKRKSELLKYVKRARWVFE